MGQEKRAELGFPIIQRVNLDSEKRFELLVILNRILDGLLFRELTIGIDVGFIPGFMGQTSRTTDTASDATHAFDKVEIDLPGSGFD